MLHQCSGDSNPLLLAAGQLIYSGKRFVSQTYAVEALQSQLQVLPGQGKQASPSTVIRKSACQHIL
ncbi:hypothetical protein HME01_33420 [Vreelandella aquamarina]|nr:hypothetical protein HME01_33420 [Halomonas meridiana]